MRPEFAQAFRDGKGGRYDLRTDLEQNGVVLEGALVSQRGGPEVPIRRGIARFVPAENYAQSFGYQWQHFSRTQLDSAASWNAQSDARFYAETEWSRDLRGKRILEAGSGMGRFTEVLARTGAEVHTFDFSAAIDANRANIGERPNVSFAQADIYAPPYEPGSFDKVLCLGVIQHCPDPERAFRSLCRFLKPGGQIVIDVYRLNWKAFFYGKYYARPFVRTFSNERLHKLVERHVGRVYRITQAMHKLSPSLGRRVSSVLAVADYRGLYGLDDVRARELSELDTFDMLAPKYDKPQTLWSVKRWMESAGLEDVRVRPGYNGIEARGTRPVPPGR